MSGMTNPGRWSKDGDIVSFPKLEEMFIGLDMYERNDFVEMIMQQSPNLRSVKIEGKMINRICDVNLSLRLPFLEIFNISYEFFCFSNRLTTYPSYAKSSLRKALRHDLPMLKEFSIPLPTNYESGPTHLTHTNLDNAFSLISKVLSNHEDREECMKDIDAMKHRLLQNTTRINA